MTGLQSTLTNAHACRILDPQLVFLNHSSVFVNDSREAARVLQEIPSKGELYRLFRLDPHTSDYFSSDGEDFTQHHSALLPHLTSFVASETSSQFAQPLLEFLASHADQTIDIEHTLILFVLDFVCEEFFHYPLQALQGSAQGQRLFECMHAFRQAMFKDGLYPNPLARNVTPEELQRAKDDWKAFVHTLADHITAQLSTQSAHSSSPFFKLWTAVQPPLQLTAEVHSLLQHAYETLAGTLIWSMYTLAKHKRVREKVEAACKGSEGAETASDERGIPEYLYCFLNEVLRRYPVAGNFTVRTPETPFSLLGGMTVPAGVPIHVHMFSLHNTSREWVRPMDIVPERWMSSSASPEERNEDEGETEDNAREKRANVEVELRGISPRQCPFHAKASSSSTTAKQVYDGAGFHPQSLSFFPFSAGTRVCPGRHLSVRFLVHTLYQVIGQYHLDFSDALGWDDDPGISLDSSIMPLNPKILQMRVSRVGGEAGK